MGRCITPDTKKIARCGFVSKTYPKPYLLADFTLNCYNAYAAAHPHFRASWCITGASCTVKVPVHHNASPVHHTVHHRVHQKGALRCIKAGWLSHATAELLLPCCKSVYTTQESPATSYGTNLSQLNRSFATALCSKSRLSFLGALPHIKSTYCAGRGAHWPAARREIFWSWDGNRSFLH